MHRLRTIAPLLGLSGLLAAAATPAAAPAAPATPSSQRAVVPVLAEIDGSSFAQRLRGAQVRVHAVGGDGRERLVGSARSGRRGVALVGLTTPTVPRRMRVTATGGRVGGQRFDGTLQARVDGSASHAVVLTPPSTLAALHAARRPRGSLTRATALTRRALALPARLDFAVAVADRGRFDGTLFLRRARANGGFDRYAARLAARPAGARPTSFTTAAARRRTQAAVARWTCAARSTGGFARHLGMASAGSTPACAARAASAPAARTAALGPNDVFADALGIAGLVYSVAAGAGSGRTAAQTAAQIQGQLTAIQGQLTSIGQQLSALSTAVDSLSAEVATGDVAISSEIADGVISDIQVTSMDAAALLAAAELVYADAYAARRPVAVRSIPTIAQLCDGVTRRADRRLFLACNLYTNAVGNLTAQVRAQGTTNAAVVNLAKYAVGQAAGGSGAGIVQLALQEGGAGQPFFDSSDATAARLEWAYYTLYALYAQALEGAVLTLAYGQRLPSGTIVNEGVIAADGAVLDAPITALLGAYPNMPDGATLNLADGSLWATSVGASAPWSGYASAPLWQLSGNGIYASTGGGLAPTANTSGSAPVATTLLRRRWTFSTALRAAATKGRSLTPQIATATYQDWQAGQQATLASLYAQARPASGQTAGQWMTAASGIDAALLTPQGVGYQRLYTGSFVSKGYPKGSADGMTLGACVPDGDPHCLLPTWLSPSQQPQQGTTGMFDYNSGVAITNQSGEPNCPASVQSTIPAFGQQWGQWANWAGQVNGPAPWLFGSVLAFFQGDASVWQGGNAAIPDLPCMLSTPPAGVQVNDQGQATAGSSGWYQAEVGPGQYETMPTPTNFSALGSPILFSRAQSANDCFYYGGSASRASGPGCLRRRTSAAAVLPRAAPPYGNASATR